MDSRSLPDTSRRDALRADSSREPDGGQISSEKMPSDDLPDAESQAVCDEADFRRQYPLAWWGTLVGPFLLTSLLLLAIWELAGPRVLGRVCSTALATYLFFGKFVILGGGEGGIADAHKFFTSEQLVLLVLYMDLITACILSFHMGFLFRLPYVGTRLKALVADGQFILSRNPWMKRATFIGLVAFVMFPLAATGSVGGSILGRLLGMSRPATLGGIMLGNVLGCAVMYFGSELITRHIDRDNPWLVVGGITVIAAFIFVLNRRYQQLKRRSQEAMASAK